MGFRRICLGGYEADPAYPGDDSGISEVRLRLSGLPLVTRRTHRFGTWNDCASGQEALQAALALARGDLDPPFLLLYGGPGLGKTHLALAAGWWRVLSGRSVAYYQASNFLDTLREGYRVEQSLGPGELSPDTYRAVLEYAKKVSLLILDDLGAQKETEWASEKLDQVVACRYLERLAMVTTSNTLDIPTRVLDRFKEGTIIRLKGASYRGKKL